MSVHFWRHALQKRWPKCLNFYICVVFLFPGLLSPNGRSRNNKGIGQVMRGFCLTPVCFCSKINDYVLILYHSPKVWTGMPLLMGLKGMDWSKKYGGNSIQPYLHQSLHFKCMMSHPDLVHLSLSPPSPGVTYYPRCIYPCVSCLSVPASSCLPSQPAFFLAPIFLQSLFVSSPPGFDPFLS